MGEPLSMVLAGMAIATALKDVIELWDRVAESFARVSKNANRTQKLTSDIRNTLEQLAQYCSKHGEALSESVDMMTAMWNLKMKLEIVNKTCQALIPQVSEKHFQRYKLQYYAWKNGGQIEEEFTELRKDIENCYTKFIMFASIRTEVMLVKFNQTNSSRLDAIVDAVCKSAVSNAHIYSFAYPKSSILRSPSMDELVLHRMYLQLEVNSVIKILDQLSAEISCNPNILGKCLDLYPAPLPLPCSNYDSEEINTCHENSVHLALQIKNILQSQATSLPLHAGGILLGNLANRLSVLGMFKEAIEIQTWAVKLYQILMPLDINSYLKYLIYQLSCLTNYHLDRGNLDAASQTVNEAVKTIQDLEKTTGSATTQLQLGNGFAGTKQSLQLAEEAIGIFKENLQVKQSRLPEDKVSMESTFLVAKFFKVKATDKSFIIHLDYMHAMKMLSNILCGNGRIQDSISIKMQSLAIMHGIFSYSPHSSIKLPVAGIFLDLTNSDIRSSLSQHCSSTYLKQAIKIYQKYSNLHPNKYGMEPCEELQQKALILWEMEHQDDATSCWTAATEITGNFAKDQLYLPKMLCQFHKSLDNLNHLEEAIMTGKWAN